MDKLEQMILQRASGEQRLDPDQQRQFLGTFRERVVLTVKKEDMTDPNVINAFPHILNELASQYPNLTAKLSGQLSTPLQLQYRKLLQAKQLPTTTVAEANASCPFGIVIHTNKAENVETTDVFDQFSSYFTNDEKSNKQPKRSFWSKLFYKE